MEQEVQFNGDPAVVVDFSNTPTTPIETAHTLADRRSAGSDDFSSDPHDFYRSFTPHRSGRPDIVVENSQNGMPTASQAQARSRQQQQGAHPKSSSSSGLNSSRSGVRSASSPALSAAAKSGAAATTTAGNRTASGGVKALAARFEQTTGKTSTTQSPGKYPRQKPLATFKSVAVSPTQTASSSFPPPRPERSGPTRTQGSHNDVKSNGISPTGTAQRSRSRPWHEKGSAQRSFDSTDHQSSDAGSSRAPLFGEVVAGQDNSQSPGYGIQAFVEKRAGSEGTVFPRARVQSSMDPSKIDSAYDPSFSRPASSSDHPHHPDDINGMPYPDTLESPMEDIPMPMSAPSEQARRRHVSPQSRIPVYTKTARSPSESYASSHSPRHGFSSAESHRGRNNSHPSTTSAPFKSPTGKDHHGHRRPVTPPNMLSSRRYDPGTKSASGGGARSLKAQVQIPLPKKSPPLRSSRPRQPVSAAAGFASRETSLDLPATSRDAIDGETSPLSGYGRGSGRAELEADEFAAHTNQLQQVIDQGEGAHRGVGDAQGLPALSLNTGDTVQVETFNSDTDIEIDESPVLGATGGLPSIRNPALTSDDSAHLHGSVLDAPKTNEAAQLLPGFSMDQQALHLDPAIYSEHDANLSIGSLVAGLRNRRRSSASRTEFTDSPELGDEASIHIALGATPRPLDHSWEVGVHGDEPILQSMPSRMDLEQDHLQAHQFPNDRRHSMSEDTVFDGGEDNIPSPSEANCSVAPDDSISMVAHPRLLTPTLHSHPERYTITSDARSVINRVLEEYHQGYVTPEMAYGFQQQVEAVTPHLSRHSEWRSAEATQEYLESILKAWQALPQDAATPVRDPPMHWIRTPDLRSIDDLDRSPPDGNHGHGTAIIFRNPDPYLDARSAGSPSLEFASQHTHTGSTSTVRPPFGRVTSETMSSQPPTPPQKDRPLKIPVDPAQLNARSPLDLLASRLSADVHMSDLESSGESLGLAIQVPPPISRVTTPPAPVYTPPLPPMSSGIDEALHNANVEDPSPNGYGPHSSAIDSRPVSIGVDSHDSQNSLDIPRDVIDPQLTTVGSLADIIRASAIAQATPESDPKKAQKDLKMRHHTIDELINTEYTFHQDMTIFEDIYKATSFNLKNMNDILTHEDRTLIFRNSDEVRNFGRGFHRALKQAAGEIYKPPKDDRFNAMKRESDATQESVATTQSEFSNAPDSESAKIEADWKTTIGKVFCENLEDMGRVFSHFLQHQDAAQRRAVQVAKEPNVQRWLEECRATSTDLTNAWNLDSFILKPFQRLCKYPLLLRQIVGVTPKDHPDYPDLEKALEGVHVLIKSVDEEKRRTDTLRDIFAKKPRKDSVDKGGIRKVLPWNVRNGEKIKEQQKVTANVKAADPDYEHVAQRFGGHFFQLQIVIRDIEKYVETLKESMGQYMKFIDALHDFIQGQTLEDWTSMQSACYTHIRAIKEIHKKLLPAHLKNVKDKVIQPIINCWDLHHKTQKAMAKRKKRVPFYLKWQEAVAKGVKPDKEIETAGIEFKALNDALKQELPKLYALCRTLVENCLRNFIDLQLLWIRHWEKANESIYGIDQNSASLSIDIANAAKKYLAAHSEMAFRVNSMAIVNGAALHDITNFMVPMRDQLDDSFVAAAKNRSQVNLSDRSPSFAGSRTAYFSPEPRRQSTGISHSPLQPMFSPLDISTQSSPKPRPRASSTQQPPTPHSGSTKFYSASVSQSAGPSRPQTSSGRPDTESSSGPPRLSLDLPLDDQHSAGLSLLTPERPVLPKTNNPFVSALPMSDSPIDGIPPDCDEETQDRPVMFLAASLFEFNIDNSHTEGGLPYLRYVPGEIFDVIGLKGELWLARNQDDPSGLIGWIWEKHFARILPENV